MTVFIALDRSLVKLKDKIDNPKLWVGTNEDDRMQKKCFAITIRSVGNEK